MSPDSNLNERQSCAELIMDVKSIIDRNINRFIVANIMSLTLLLNEMNRYLIVEIVSCFAVTYLPFQAPYNS